MAKTKTFTSVRAEEHVISEADGRRSREQIVLSSPTVDTLAGTVLGRILEGAATVVSTARAGNTGDGTMLALPTADAGIEAGDYTLTIIAAAANAGTFRVEKPDGTEDGVGTVGVAYNGSINFTLQDGAADFIVGDGFTINVSYADGGGEYVPLDPAAVNGAEIPAAVLAVTEIVLDPVADIRTSAHVRDCELNGWKLAWPVGISAGDKAAAEATLAEAGVIVRY